MSLPRLLLASGNNKKLAELELIAGGLGVTVLGPARLAADGKPPLPEVVEDGDTFLANGLKKALSGLQHVRSLGEGEISVLSDDSGLCVRALQGRPGVHSARWARLHGGDPGQDDVDGRNRRELLKNLQGIEDRAAWFQCTLVLAGPLAEGPGCGRTQDGLAWRAFSGQCHGTILDAEVGQGGFGYDCVFQSRDLGATFAEATGDRKHSVSHRGRAMAQLAAWLVQRQHLELDEKPMFVKALGVNTLAEALRRTLDKGLRYADQALEQALGAAPQLGAKERLAVAQLHWHALRRLDLLELALAALKGHAKPTSAPDPRKLSSRTGGLLALLTLADVDPSGRPRDAVRKVGETALEAVGKRNPALACSWPATPAQLTTALRAATWAARDMREPARTALELGFAPAFVEKLQDELGADHARLAMGYLNQRGPLTLRVHSGRAKREDVAAQLASLEIATLPVPDLADALWCLHSARVTATPAFLNGYLEIQDEGSQRIAAAVQALPGQLVLDWCAGAGGKTLALGAALQGRGRLIACDTHPERLAECKRRAERAQVTVETRVLDKSLRPFKDLVGLADAVLVDAPCSSTGALRRNPELRWHLDADWLGRFPAQQLAILRRASQHVRPGGRLVYATCSLMRAENEAVVQQFLQAEPEFVLLEQARLGPANGEWLQHMPVGAFGPDGFYWCAMQRRASGQR